MILIAGATGVLGSAVSKRLLAEGMAVRVLTREPTRAQALRAAGAEVLTGDLRDPEAVRRACEGATHVLTTANAFTGRGAQSIEAVDLEGTRHLLDAARGQRVRQFVFTSARLPPEYYAIDYFDAKRRNEDQLRQSGVPFTILKPTAFMETWARMILDGVVQKGVAQIFGSGQLPVNFVSVNDVAAVAAMVVDRPDALNADVEIGGPENLTLIQVVDIVERVTGRKARRKHLPLTLLRVMPTFVRPFNPVFARAVQAGALMASIPQPFDASAMLAHYPISPTRLEDWVRAAWASTRTAA
jgi:NADH dehydrogenase